MPLLLSLATPKALSQDFEATAIQTVELGGGLAVILEQAPCFQRDQNIHPSVWRPPGYEFGHWRDQPCTTWRPAGFAFGDRQELLYAYAFARVASSGRIVATYRDVDGAQRAPGSPPTPPGTAVGVLYTDDGGATWHDARWRWVHAARALAFDAGSDFGVAAGESGHVWSTEDGGETWRVRRSAAGVSYTQVAVVGRVCVLVDANGTVWRSRDGGFSHDTLTRSSEVTLETTDDEIVVTTPRHELRIHADASVERSRR